MFTIDSLMNHPLIHNIYIPYIYTTTLKQSLEAVFWLRWTKQATIQSFILVQTVGVQKKLSPKDNSYKKMKLYLTRGRCHYMTRGR